MAIQIDSTNGITNATWITGNRPASPVAGQMGYNTSLNVLEFWTGSAWYSNSINTGTASTWTALQTFSAGITANAITDSGLTATQLVYAGTGGLLSSDPDMTFDGTSLTLANDALVHGVTVGLGAGSVPFNTALGSAALAANTTGSANTAVGRRALNSNTTGCCNTATGQIALQANTTGCFNTAHGQAALQGNTTGCYNTASGVQALNLNTTGTTNTAVGYAALFANVTGSNNVAVGDSALAAHTVDNTTALGSGALQANTTGNFNTAVGYNAMNANTIGISNTAVGCATLQANTTGSYNTAVGTRALCSNTTGICNVAHGGIALCSNTTGNNNTAYGVQALYSNTTGSSNVGIGVTATASSPTVSNEVNIYNGSVTARFQGAAGAWNFVSDVRDKSNITDLTLGLDFVNALQPRRFEWTIRNSDVDQGKPAAGFIAQEVLAVTEAQNANYTNLVDTNDPNQYTFAATNLIPILTNAIKELSAKVATLEAALAAK